MYWERTALNEIVVRNCSEMDPELGGKKFFDTLRRKKMLFCEKKFNSQDLIVNFLFMLPRDTLWISYKNLVWDEGNISYLLSLSVLITSFQGSIYITGRSYILVTSGIKKVKRKRYNS